MNKVYGYVRVSSKEQNEGRQLQAIKEYCKDNNIELGERDIIIDKESGKDFNRQGYQTLKTQLARQGDTIIIKELDRLGRNKAEIKKELEYLKNKGVIVRILNIPTTLIELPKGSDWVMDMVNNVLIEVMGAIAEEERQKIRQRQKEGIEQAKKAGKHLGRPRLDWDTLEQEQRDKIKEYYPIWKSKEITATKFMEIVELERNTFYKIMKEYKERGLNQ